MHVIGIQPQLKPPTFSGDKHLLFVITSQNSFAEVEQVRQTCKSWLFLFIYGVNDMLHQTQKGKGR